MNDFSDSWPAVMAFVALCIMAGNVMARLKSPLFFMITEAVMVIGLTIQAFFCLGQNEHKTLILVLIAAGLILTGFIPSKNSDGWSFLKMISCVSGIISILTTIVCDFLSGGTIAFPLG